jgi:hypothetical protein
MHHVYDDGCYPNRILVFSISPESREPQLGVRSGRPGAWKSSQVAAAGKARPRGNGSSLNRHRRIKIEGVEKRSVFFASGFRGELKGGRGEERQADELLLSATTAAGEESGTNETYRFGPGRWRRRRGRR